MGHSSPDITDSVYTHKTITELIEAVDLIWFVYYKCILYVYCVYIIDKI
jgi:hypothetical protein